jgi:cytochrome c oxidase cbb3-type subunit III
MTEKKIDQLLASDYDGIQEYDNDLPRWWVWLFALTVIAGVAWAGYVHVFESPTDEELLASEMLQLASQRAAHAPKISGAEALLAIAADTSRAAKGQSKFVERCAACHGQKGEGLVGPNLTDEYWIHGGEIDQIHSVIVNGVLAKGMLAWKGVMPDSEIEDVTAYLWSIRNTNLPGKAAQGEKG